MASITLLHGLQPAGPPQHSLHLVEATVGLNGTNTTALPPMLAVPQVAIGMDNANISTTMATFNTQHRVTGCAPKGQRRSCGLINHVQHIQACKVCSRLGRLRNDHMLLGCR